MIVPYSEKKLELTITLGTGTFGEQLGNTVTLSNLRMYVDLTDPTGDSMGTCQARVFGLTESMMNQLTVIGLIGQAKPKNTILIAAGDEVNGMSVIFEGIITVGWPDYSAAPDVVFNIIAFVQMSLALKPVGATSVQGTADVATLMKGFADLAGLSFVNNGVDVKLSNPYFPGTLWTQIKACARAANISQRISLGTLTIWPNGYSDQNDTPLLLSPQTGMVGYPSFSNGGMTVKSIFNPNLKVGRVQAVKSSIKVANGNFVIFNCVHNLSSQVPDGPWFTTVDCVPRAQ